MANERLTVTDRSPNIDTITSVNERLGRMTAENRIGWVTRMFDQRKIILTTSGGETSSILPTLMSKTLRKYGKSPSFTIVFVDTHLYDQSTIDFVQGLSERGQQNGYEVQTYQPRMTLRELSHEHPDWHIYGSVDFEKAKRIMKVEPLERAFRELGAHCWTSGQMRWEMASRANMPVIDRREDGLYAFHPIADWTEGMAKRYIAAYNLPTNPNHHDPFKGLNQKSECGIHAK